MKFGLNWQLFVKIYFTAGIPRAGAVAQGLGNLFLRTQTSFIGAPATPLPNQLPVDVPEESAEDGHDAWVPVTHVGDPEIVTGSWLQPVRARLKQSPRIKSAGCLSV